MFKIEKKDILLTCAAFSLFLLPIICMMSFALDIPISTAVTLIQAKLYRPHFNIFEVYQIGDVHPLKALYIVLLLTALILILFYRISLPNKLSKYAPQLIFLTYLLGILTVATLNFVMRIKYYKHDLKLYHGKTLDEKNFLLNHEPYLFVEKVRNVLSGRHSGEFITTENLLEDPHMTTHRILSFYLYPIISLRLDNNTPKDIFIYYHTDDSRLRIPNDQKILTTSNDLSLTLTIKNKDSSIRDINF